MAARFADPLPDAMCGEVTGGSCVISIWMLCGAGKNAGHMDGVEALLLPMQRSTQVHQATIIKRRAVRGVGGKYISKFGIEHCRGNFGILDGKRPTESAAPLQVRERNEFKSTHVPSRRNGRSPICSPRNPWQLA